VCVCVFVCVSVCARVCVLQTDTRTFKCCTCVNPGSGAIRILCLASISKTSVILAQSKKVVVQLQQDTNKGLPSCFLSNPIFDF